jgi:flagellar basal-body rod protein FlgC
MTLMTAIDISASGLRAQRLRFEVAVSNLVNANTAQPAGMEPFRRKNVVFSAAPPQTSFGSEFETAVQGVEISKVVIDNSDPDPHYEPGNPLANKDGYVMYPHINTSEEMADALSATRSYEANLQAVTAAKEMAQRTLEILK